MNRFGFYGSTHSVLLHRLERAFFLSVARQRVAKSALM